MILGISVEPAKNQLVQPGGSIGGMMMGVAHMMFLIQKKKKER